MSETMGKQEAAESNQEWNEPLAFEDWQQCRFAQQTLSDAYFEESEELREALELLTVMEVNKREQLQSAAYCAIDCKMDDEYQQYKAMHPHTIGYFTQTFSDIYSEDGL